MIPEHNIISDKKGYLQVHHKRHIDLGLNNDCLLTAERGNMHLPCIFRRQVIKEGLGLVVVATVDRRFLLLMGHIFGVAGFFSVQRFLICGYI